MKLPVLIICGPFCNVNAGRLYVAMYQALSTTEEIIEIDFTGTTGTTAAFLADSFGKLFDHFPKKALLDRLQTVHLDPPSMELLRVVIEHADQYKNHSQYRKIIDLIQQRPQGPDADVSPIRTEPPNRPPKSPYSQVATKALEV